MRVVGFHPGDQEGSAAGIARRTHDITGDEAGHRIPIRRGRANRVDSIVVRSENVHAQGDAAVSARRAAGLCPSDGAGTASWSLGNCPSAKSLQK